MSERLGGAAGSISPYCRQLPAYNAVCGGLVFSGSRADAELRVAARRNQPTHPVRPKMAATNSVRHDGADARPVNLRSGGDASRVKPQGFCRAAAARENRDGGGSQAETSPSPPQKSGRPGSFCGQSITAKLGVGLVGTAGGLALLNPPFGVIIPEALDGPLSRAPAAMFRRSPRFRSDAGPRISDSDGRHRDRPAPGMRAPGPIPFLSVRS
jgi:hypothetical protein